MLKETRSVTRSWLVLFSAVHGFLQTAALEHYWFSIDLNLNIFSPPVSICFCLFCIRPVELAERLGYIKYSWSTSNTLKRKGLFSSWGWIKLHRFLSHPEFSSHQILTPEHLRRQFGDLFWDVNVNLLTLKFSLTAQKWNAFSEQRYATLPWRMVNREPSGTTRTSERINPKEARGDQQDVLNFMPLFTPVMRKRRHPNSRPRPQHAQAPHGVQALDHRERSVPTTCHFYWKLAPQSIKSRNTHIQSCLAICSEDHVLLFNHFYGPNWITLIK